MSNPTMTVKAYLDSMRLPPKMKQRRRGLMVTALMNDVDPSLLVSVRHRGYTVAAQWQWTLDTLHQAYADVCASLTAARGQQIQRRQKFGVIAGGAA